MIAVDVTTDTEVLDAHDFDIPCQVAELVTLDIGIARVPMHKPRMCTAPAAWLATCRTCGSMTYVCGPHRAQQADHVYAKCLTCHTEGTCDEVFTFASITFGASS
jgi:hypothetical protein